jgi:hypothetical protein
LKAHRAAQAERVQREADRLEAEKRELRRMLLDKLGISASEGLEIAVVRGFLIGKLCHLRFQLTRANNALAILAWWSCRCGHSHANRHVVETLADLGATVAEGLRTEDSCRG